MEVKVRFKNKISEPLYTASDLRIISKKKKNETLYCLEFRVCKSMGIAKTYSFDSTDEKLLQTLLEKIKAKGEFLFDEGCKACEETALDYDSYVKLSESGELKGDMKFGDDGGYVIAV